MLPASADDRDQLAQLLDLIVDHVEAVDTRRLASLAAQLLARLLELELNDWPTPKVGDVLTELVPAGLDPEREAQLVSLLERLLNLLRNAADLGLGRETR